MQEHDNKHIINNCIAGVCSKCGKCCTDFLPLTLKEAQLLKLFVEENQIQLTDWTSTNPLTNQREIQMLCPLLDKKTKLCKAYEVRPNICRTFKCCKDPQLVFKERDTIAKNSKYNKLSNHTGYLTNVYSLYEILTGDKTKTIQLMISLSQSNYKKLTLDEIMNALRVFGRTDITKEEVQEVLSSMNGGN